MFCLIGGRKDAQLVTDGPYSLCRHPLYVLSFMGSIGLGLATRSFCLTVVTAVVMAVLLSSAARAEGHALAEKYGAEYQAYAKLTPAWCPSWRNYRLPESLAVSPAIFWKSFLDAGSFVLLYLLIENVRVLRESGIFATLVRIP